MPVTESKAKLNMSDLSPLEAPSGKAAFGSLSAAHIARGVGQATGLGRTDARSARHFTFRLSYRRAAAHRERRRAIAPIPALSHWSVRTIRKHDGRKIIGFTPSLSSTSAVNQQTGGAGSLGLERQRY
jgi:hypothetical protein